MSFLDLLLFILFIQVLHFLGTWKLYQSAGRHWWEAAIPVYNAIVLFKIINGGGFFFYSFQSLT
jgi:signal peptidase I